MISLERLKYLLDYDPITGFLIWKIDRKRVKAGRRAGYISNNYRMIEIENKTYYEHILIWFYMTNEWPPKEIDHKNRIKNDNRWDNLRSASKSENNCNKTIKSNNTTGYTGVIKHRNKYQARITSNGKHTYIGTFDNPEDASKEYQKYAEILHKEFKAL